MTIPFPLLWSPLVLFLFNSMIPILLALRLPLFPGPVGKRGLDRS